MTHDTAVRRTHYWSLASLIFGILGLMLALTAPIPLVPFISWLNWPLGLAALLAGWKGGQEAKAAGDARSAARARWGMRLGCMGWTVQFITSTIKVLVVAGLLISMIAVAVNNVFSPPVTPTP